VANANSKTYGQTVTETGSQTGVVNNDGITASFASSGDARFAGVGTYTISAMLSDPNRRLGNYTVHETDANLVVNPAHTTVGLVSSANPSRVGQAVTFTVTLRPVSPSTALPPPGETVTFLDGSTVLGTGTLDIFGHATFTTSRLAAGTHSIAAVYAGDVNLLGSQSVILDQIVGDGPDKITGAGFLDEALFFVHFNFAVQTVVQHGVTSFQGNLTFHVFNVLDLRSTAITLIAVNPDGMQGMFQGTATLNGRPGYTFTVYVDDNDNPVAGPDMFRILITGPGGFSYDSDASATLGGLLVKGGHIEVHKGDR
jgi:hypothetical protein